MMLFDPDEGLPVEEMIQRKWDRMPQAKKDLFQAVAERQGMTAQELFNERLEAAIAEFEDPANLARINARFDFAEQPFGPDPRLSQDGAR